MAFGAQCPVAVVARLTATHRTVGRRARCAVDHDAAPHTWAGAWAARRAVTVVSRVAGACYCVCPAVRQAGARLGRVAAAYLAGHTCHTVPGKVEPGRAGADHCVGGAPCCTGGQLDERRRTKLAGSAGDAVAIVARNADACGDIRRASKHTCLAHRSAGEASLAWRADDSVAVVACVARADDAVHCAARLTLTQLSSGGVASLALLTLCAVAPVSGVAAARQRAVREAVCRAAGRDEGVTVCAGAR